MSKAERQRQFRERNPGYYGRLHRKRTAAIMASLAEKAAAKVAVKTPLMLPAPVELIVIPWHQCDPVQAYADAGAVDCVDGASSC